MSDTTVSNRTDIIFEFACIDRFVLRCSDIEELEEPREDLRERIKSCQIYLLCTRPRLSLVPDTVHADRTRVAFEVTWQRGAQRFTSGVEIPRSRLLPEEVSFRSSEYPHRELVSLSASNQVIGTTLLANLVPTFSSLPQDVSDLDVL